MMGDRLRDRFVGLETDRRFTEAVVTLDDGSRLCLCHRVGERWAKAVGPEGDEDSAGAAREFLDAIGMFRLNAKHLEILFSDGSLWERRPGGETDPVAD